MSEAMSIQHTYLVAYSFHLIDVSLMRKANPRLSAWDEHLVESFSLVLLSSSLWSLSLPVRSLQIHPLHQHILDRHPTKIMSLMIFFVNYHKMLISCLISGRFCSGCCLLKNIFPASLLREQTISLLCVLCSC